jgi:SAM-dependent methyltransferase
VTDALEDEFDVVAAWTEQAIGELGPDYAIAAACRGSGSPAALGWLADTLGVRRAGRMLDAGSGLGGPGAWLARHVGLRPVCAEPMPAAALASRRLFGLPAVVATGEALPFPAGTFDVAWCLGVLDTAPDKAGLLTELHRVLVPGGRLGLLAFLAIGPLPPPLPEGNDFCSPSQLDELLRAARFQTRQTVPAESLPQAPASWQARTERVEELLARRHADDPRWQTAQEQTARVARLISGGHLRPVLMHAAAV